MAISDSIILNVNKKNEKKIKFLRESLEIDNIMTIPTIQKIKCFFNNMSDEKQNLPLRCCVMLEIEIIPKSRIKSVGIITKLSMWLQK